MFMNAVELGSQVAKAHGTTRIVEAGVEFGEEVKEGLFDKPDLIKTTPEAIEEAKKILFDEPSIIETGVEFGEEVKEGLFDKPENEDKTLGQRVLDFLTGGIGTRLGEKLAENISK